MYPCIPYDKPRVAAARHVDTAPRRLFWHAEWQQQTGHPVSVSSWGVPPVIIIQSWMTIVIIMYHFETHGDFGIFHLRNPHILYIQYNSHPVSIHVFLHGIWCPNNDSVAR
jgi:hypothetical protein